MPTKTTTKTTNDDETPIKKVLSRQDQRNLEKVIDGDFRNAQNDITAAYETHMKGVRDWVKGRNVVEVPVP